MTCPEKCFFLQLGMKREDASHGKSMDEKAFYMQHTNGANLHTTNIVCYSPSDCWKPTGHHANPLTAKFTHACVQLLI